MSVWVCAKREESYWSSVCGKRPDDERIQRASRDKDKIDNLDFLHYLVDLSRRYLLSELVFGL